MLWSRNGNNIDASFPEIVDALHSVLDHRETVLDGEIVALGPDGVPSFSLLQRRMHVLRPTAQLRNEAVTSYYVFDVLDIYGTSTTDLPYLERREALANLSLEHPRIKVPPHWLNVDGPTMLEVLGSRFGFWFEIRLWKRDGVPHSQLLLAAGCQERVSGSLSSNPMYRMSWRSSGFRVLWRKRTRSPRLGFVGTLVTRRMWPPSGCSAVIVMW